MKLQINYDLIDKIKEAKTGMVLKLVPAHVLGGMVIFTPMNMNANIADNTPEKIVPELIAGGLMITALSFGAELAFASTVKEKSKEELEVLATQLAKINISTTQDLIMETEKYKTEYELLEKNDEGIRKIQQNKYILVPTSNKEEVSILQEHIVGTDKYALSIGEPKKVYKLSLANNPA